MTYQLLDPASGRIVDLPTWEWADLDGDRLVWAEAGRLWAGALGDDGVRETTVLRDFNGMRFERLVAPYAVDGEQTRG